jgi:hypothetical protein
MKNAIQKDFLVVIMAFFVIGCSSKASEVLNPAIDTTEAKLDKNICLVHNIKTKKQKAGIVYEFGQVSFCPPEETKEKFFPNCSEVIFGGCVIWDERPQVEQNVCEQCNIARNEWEQNYISTILEYTTHPEWKEEDL